MTVRVENRWRNPLAFRIGLSDASANEYDVSHKSGTVAPWHAFPLEITRKGDLTTNDVLLIQLFADEDESPTPRGPQEEIAEPIGRTTVRVSNEWGCQLHYTITTSRCYGVDAYHGVIDSGDSVPIVFSSKKGQMKKGVLKIRLVRSCVTLRKGGTLVERGIYNDLQPDEEPERQESDVSIVAVSSTVSHEEMERPVSEIGAVLAKVDVLMKMMDALQTAIRGVQTDGGSQ